MVVVVVIVGAGAFFGGMKYQQNQTAATAATRGAGRFGANGGTAGINRPVAGNILSADANSITVQLTDGSSKIVLISPSTTLEKSATASAADLKAGMRVSAFGATNSDGSVTATNVQINPIGPTGAGRTGQPTQPGQ